MKKQLSKPDLLRKQKLEAFDRLLTIMDELRENCPWDKEQTMESIRHLTIEETYELSDAILEGNLEEVKKELGDVMLSIVFYSRIASETNDFDISDVIHSVCDKLVRRHPHIYGDEKVKNEEEAKAAWEKSKLKEKGTKSVLGGVPKSLPSLIKAMRIQEKTREAGWAWDKEDKAWDTINKTLNNFKKEKDNKMKYSEYGALLFSLIGYAQFTNINPEDALEQTNLKFIKHFQRLELESKKEGESLPYMTLNKIEHTKTK